MSRSNPVDAVRNPCERWFEWAGGEDGGFVRYYDKERNVKVPVPLPFSFLLLDELASVRGFSQRANASIFSNEVRNIKFHPMTVKVYNGPVVAQGTYREIKDAVERAGASFHASLYIAYRDEDGIHLGNLSLKGAALNEWVEFKRAAKSVKTEGGSIKAYWKDAIVIGSFKEGQNGRVVFRSPVFGLRQCSDATNKEAETLDAMLQGYLVPYLEHNAATMVPAPAADPRTPVAPERPAPAQNTLDILPGDPGAMARQGTPPPPAVDPVSPAEERHYAERIEETPYADVPFEDDDIPF